MKKTIVAMSLDTRCELGQLFDQVSIIKNQYCSIPIVTVHTKKRDDLKRFNSIHIDIVKLEDVDDAFVTIEFLYYDENHIAMNPSANCGGKTSDIDGLFDMLSDLLLKYPRDTPIVVANYPMIDNMLQYEITTTQTGGPLIILFRR